MDKARALCIEKGVRFTPLRERVYNLLLEQEGSLGAYDILDRLKATDSTAKPPTVYRALDFLQTFGLVHKVESSNSYMACQHIEQAHPVQILICTECELVVELKSNAVKTALSDAASQHQFTIVDQTIEAHGLCADCVKKLSDDETDEAVN